MTDRPILFSAPMVRALLDGRKTQTRRILKPQPQGHVWRYGWSAGNGATFNADDVSGRIPIWAGYRLWVRETWRAHGWHGDCVEIAYAAQRGQVGWSEQHLQIPYPKGDRNAFKYYAPKGPDFWRPSLFMPRWASRISLSVTDVRIERLQDISEADARAEGCPVTWDGKPYDPPPPEVDSWQGYGRASYCLLWSKINGHGSWDANPWVVAYTFTVHRQNIDQLARAA